MNKIEMLGCALVILLLSVGLGAAACTPPTIGCTRTVQEAIPEGTTVTLQTPEHTDQGRDLEWTWVLYDCAGNILTDLYKISTTNTAKEFSFRAPPAGDYYVGLTVRDKDFKTTCHDTKTLCFTTSCSPVHLCCGYLCNADVDPGTNICPWYSYYDGQIADYRFSWYVDGHLVKQGTGSDNAWYRIDWTNGVNPATYTDISTSTVYTIGDGVHAVTFKKERPVASGGSTTWVEVPQTGCLPSCTCTGTPTITGCTVYIVPQPVATISGP